MSFGGSADIFRAQIMDLMAALEYVQAYMDDFLIIMRETLDEKLQKMETVLTRLHDAGLKVIAVKSLFCAHKIEYLGYVIYYLEEGSNPNQKSASNTRAKST
jgi:hypothetical protein